MAQPTPAPGCRSEQLVYVGDRDFPPYEYLDDRGNPEGFNIDLVRALQRELGEPIVIKLLPWAEVRNLRIAGGADLFSAGYAPARDAQFDFLAQTTTVRSSLLMLPGRAAYPSGMSGLQGLRIAVQDGTPTATAFNELPIDQRPLVIAMPSHHASIALLKSGDVDAAAGAGATLRWHAADAGLVGFVEVAMNSRPYMLAVRKGCGARMAGIAQAVERLREQGAIDQMTDENFSQPARDIFQSRGVIAFAIAVLTIVVLAFAWSATLHRQVRGRTEELTAAIVEQRRLNDLIRSNEGRLSFAMDVIGEGVWEWDLAADRIVASTRWAGSFGYASDEAPNNYESWMAYIHPDDRDRVAVAAQAHIEGRAPRFEATYRVPLKNAEWIWVLDRGSIVLRDEDGKPLRMVGTLKDITIQLAAERALHEAKDAAETTSRAKSTFLATVSHEIRTPLNAIIGAAGLLEHATLPPDQRELVTVVRRAGNGLLAIVDDVLDFTKIEATRVELDERPLELLRVIEESIALVEHAARKKSLAVTAHIDADLPEWLEGDDTRLRQIVVNLLSNAVKFTDTGAVSVRVSRESHEGDLVKLRIDVTDTGLGIPSDRLDRLFQPFSQVDSSTTRKYGGTGLGLAISRRLAELMGGTLDVESVAGKGSTFTLRVGLARAVAPVVAASIASTPNGTTTALRTVLAEDNVVNQLVQRRMFLQLGHECDVVANGRQLIDAVQHGHYDIAFVDIQMPEMDGMEAAREVRARGFTRVRLVALTADVTTETRKACMLAGFDEYLPKPVTVAALEGAFARARANKEALV